MSIGILTSFSFAIRVVSQFETKSATPRIGAEAIDKLRERLQSGSSPASIATIR